LRLVPIVIASLSLTIEVLHGLLSAFRSTPSEGDHEEAENIVRRTPLQGIKRHIQYYGGYTIYGSMFGRLVGTLLLLYLSIPNTLRCQPPMGWSSGTSTTECPDYFLSLTFVSHPVISFGRYTRLATFNSSTPLSCLSLRSFQGPGVRLLQDPTLSPSCQLSSSMHIVTYGHLRRTLKILLTRLKEVFYGRRSLFWQ